VASQVGTPNAVGYWEKRQTGPRRKEFSFVVLAGEVEMRYESVSEVSWVQFCTLRREVRNRCHMPRSSKRIAYPATAMPPEVEEETGQVHQCDLQSPAAKEPVSPCRSSDQL
jgi:hypothetical protein